MTDLLKKEGFSWGIQQEQAFETLKASVTNLLILAMPDFSKLFILEIEASGSGLGIVLMQEGRPIAYFSKVMSSSSRLKSVYERELMAIILAVQKWRHYLLGRHFLIRSD